MALIVQKFGGTSVGNITRIKEVAKLVLAEVERGNQLVVVVSAMAGATNSLITLCAELSALNEPGHLQEYDAAISSGEIITAALLALELQHIGLNAVSLQGWQVPIMTNTNHGEALVSEINAEKLYGLINSGIIPVITGFQGITIEQRITTLGKGGSDTSAALIAAALGADCCDIYTDVDGIYSADPRVVHEAKKIDVITADEVMALSSAGAKVLHPRAALATVRYKFKMRILSSFIQSPTNGTLIQLENTNMENRIITAITSNKNLIKTELLCENDRLPEIISALAQDGITINELSSLQPGKVGMLTNLADKNKLELRLEALKTQGLLASFSLNSNISTVTLVGYGIKNASNLSAELISILHKEHLPVLALHATEISISVLINDQDTERAIKLLHRKYIA